MSTGTIIREGSATVERLDPRLMTGDPIYLFNIYTISETVNLGTNGIYHMPPCPEDKEYIRANAVIPGTVEGIYPHFTDKEEYRARPVPGEEVAKAFLGIASGNSADEDRRRFGWFVSKSKTPSKQELEQAHKHLAKYLGAKVRKGDELASSANPEDRKSIDDSFYHAAQRLNLKRPWMSDATELSLCPFCGVAVRPNASKCSGCNEIINRAAYEAQKKQIGL